MKFPCHPARHGSGRAESKGDGAEPSRWGRRGGGQADLCSLQEGWPWAGRDGDGDDLVSKHMKGGSLDAVISTNELCPRIAPVPSGQLAGAPSPLDSMGEGEDGG